MRNATVGHGVWRENRKSWKLRNTQCRTIWQEPVKTEKNEKDTLQDQDYVEKSEK